MRIYVQRDDRGVRYANIRRSIHLRRSMLEQAYLVADRLTFSLLSTTPPSSLGSMERDELVSEEEHQPRIAVGKNINFEAYGMLC